MSESIEELERRIDDLRGIVRRAAIAGDRVLARQARAGLRQAEGAWEQALAALEQVQPPGSPQGVDHLLPMREQVHQTLTLLTVPAAPRLIAAVHAAFFAGGLASNRLTSLRRDEEKSFRAAPYARPYYICPALTADLLGPARGLLTVSTWSIVDRVAGPLSPRVHFLVSAIKIAAAVERLDRPRPEATSLMWRFATNIPGAADGAATPAAVTKAAQAELVIHDEADRHHRAEAVRRTGKLDDVQRLFGARLGHIDDVTGRGVG